MMLCFKRKFPEKPARTIATVLDRETKKEAIEVKMDLKENVQGVKTDLKEDFCNQNTSSLVLHRLNLVRLELQNTSKKAFHLLL